MTRLRLIAGLVLATLATAVAAAEPAHDDAPALVFDNQYNAVLHQDDHHWQLRPFDGQDLTIAAAVTCPAGPTIPAGLWLVARDRDGRPELLAPSVTALPAGHPERVALRACGEAIDAGPAVVAPQMLIDWLAASTGAIYVDD